MGYVLPYLCEGIITNILKRLPVKSLIRFQCVSKDWKDLIKSPFFIREHLHHSTQRNPSLLIEQSHRYDPLFLCLLDSDMQLCKVVETPPLFSSLAGISIIGSSNGLLCLDDRTALLLWNPATREVRRVPMTEGHIPVSCSFGFGFSPAINDYKIVRIKSLARGNVVEVYSLSTGSWRNIQFHNINDIHVGHGDGVTVSGVMFWQGSRPCDDRFHCDEVIVSFDMASEVFRVIPWPFSSSNPSLEFELAAWEDRLAIISHPGVINHEDSCIHFGVMEEGVVGSSHEGKWSLSRKSVEDFHPFYLRAGTIWRNQIVCIDFELPSYLWRKEGEKGNDETKLGLYLINFAANQRQVLAIPRRPGHRISVFNYVESLVPVGNPQIEEV